MDFDFVFPVFNDVPNHLFMPTAGKSAAAKTAWQVPRTVSELDFIVELAAELERAGRTVAFLVTTNRIEERLRAQFTNVFDLYEGLVRKRPVPQEELWDLERRYKIASMHGFVYPEHAYDWALDYDDLIPRAAHVLRWLERFVTTHRVGTFVNNVGGEIIRRGINVVARAHGIANLIFEFAALPGRFVLAYSEATWNIPPAPENVPAEDLEWARGYVDSMLTNRKPWMAASALGFGRANWRGAVQALAASRYQKDVSLKRLVDERVRRVVRRVAGAALWQPVDPREKYVFFPIHLPNDSAISIRAPQFQRQEELVRFIAERALPSGAVLYVKPHIGARDSFSLDCLRAFRKTPRVRLVAPATNPHDLIENALMTVVINSTAGFESILHGKPTLVLGSPWYAGQGLTVDVPTLSELPAAMDRALSFRPSQERLLHFLAHYRSLTHAGLYGLPEPENVANVAKVLLEHARTRDSAKPAARGAAAHGVG